MHVLWLFEALITGVDSHCYSIQLGLNVKEVYYLSDIGSCGPCPMKSGQRLKSLVLSILLERNSLSFSSSWQPSPPYLKNCYSTYSKKRLGKVSYLIKCRLVCRYWGALAEKAMLEHAITIPHQMQQNIVVFVVFLEKDPARANLINHLYFELYECSLESQELLQLALTSNIESITCHVWNDHFISFFMDIVEKSFQTSLIDWNPWRYHIPKMSLHSN